LYISWIIRNIPSDRITWIPLVAALTTRRVLQRQIGNDPTVLVKWPNDLWVKEKKIAGFLAENLGSSIILGAGVNLLKTPIGLEDRATHLKEWAPLFSNHSYESLIQELNEQLLDSLKRLCLETHYFEIEYNQFTAFPTDTLVSWMEDNQVHEGIVKGLGKYAELRVQQMGVCGERALYSETVAKLTNSKVPV
jgi:BirA family biotin operon repressor/biotin-[acetyl-CoA-carboxylase] ligase